ncbi:MAG: hypothetical protein V4677_16110 [Bacteroidota bacterium]
MFIYLLAILIIEMGLLRSQEYPSLFTLLECLCIYAMFYFETTGKWFRVYLLFIPVFFIVFTIIELILWPGNDYLIIPEYLTVIVMALLFFYHLLTKLNVPKLINYPFFYFNTAFLIYFCGSFFMFLFSKQVSVLDKDIIKMITLFHCFLNIFYLSLITTGIWKTTRK